MGPGLSEANCGSDHLAKIFNRDPCKATEAGTPSSANSPLCQLCVGMVFTNCWNKAHTSMTVLEGHKVLEMGSLQGHVNFTTKHINELLKMHIWHLN